MISQAPIFTIHAELADIRHFGQTPYGERRVIDILGGRVDGPRLKGKILPGADWQIVRPDGVTDLVARYGIESDGGARIQRRAAPRSARGPRRARARRDGRAVALLFPHRDAVRDADPALPGSTGFSRSAPGRARARGPSRCL